MRGAPSHLDATRVCDSAQVAARALATGCARLLDRGARLGSPPCRRSDAGGRQLVRPRYDRSAACVRPHVVDRRPRYLRHAVHLQEERPCPPDPAARPVLGKRGRQVVHVPAEAERPLRRRHAADFRRRRLLAQATRQPERQSGVPPLRGQGVGEGHVHGRDRVEHPGGAAACRSSRTRRPASSTRSSSGRTGAPMPSMHPRPTRPSSGSTRPPPPERAAGHTSSSRTARPRRSRFERTRTTGARGSLAFDTVVIRNMPAPTQLINIRRGVTPDRDRPLRRSGGDAEGRRRPPRLAQPVAVGLLPRSRTTTRRSRRSPRTSGFSRRCATRSTTRASSPSRGRARSRLPGSSRR